jgi:predicted transcriptional regulator
LPEEAGPVRRKRPDVTDTELTVLKALWSAGASTIRELTDRVYPGGEAAHYATVQKLLERLEAKRCVRRASRGRVNVYAAAIDRAGLVARRLRDTAEKLCDGSLTPLLTHLVGAAELSRKDLAELRDLVDRLEREAAGRRGRAR